jgi:hypothetical protein
MKYWIRIIFLLLVLIACKDVPTIPEDVYVAFHKAVCEREWDYALTFLTPETREVFRNLGNDIAQALGEKGDPVEILLKGVQVNCVSPLHEVKVVFQDPLRAKVKVSAGDCKNQKKSEYIEREVNMLKVNGKWLIQPQLGDK